MKGLTLWVPLRWTRWLNLRTGRQRPIIGLSALPGIVLVERRLRGTPLGERTARHERRHQLQQAVIWLVLMGIGTLVGWPSGWLMRATLAWTLAVLAALTAWLEADAVRAEEK